MTVAISDVIVPPQKKEIITYTENAVKKVENQYQIGLITEEERYKKVVELWNKATEDVADAMMHNLQENAPFNPIYMMADSGARGNKQQMRQLAGMRGLMADPSGKIIDLPITANFREGLSVSDYFISSHGARKGLTDTALRTADSGYLTRRLVDVAQDVIVREEDCDVTSINLKLARAHFAEDTFDAISILHNELLGRVTASDIKNPSTGEVAIFHDTTLSDESLELIGQLGVSSLTLRGRSLTSPNSASHSLVRETVHLGTRSEAARSKLRHSFIHEIVGKELAKSVCGHFAGDILTHSIIESLLESDTPEIFVRNNNVRGIEVAAITEGSGIIESLADRIVGRVLAEDIFDSHGVLVAAVNDEIDKKLAKKIADIRSGSVLIFNSNSNADSVNVDNSNSVNANSNVNSVNVNSVNVNSVNSNSVNFNSDNVNAVSVDKNIIGKVLAEDIYLNDKLIINSGTVINGSVFTLLEQARPKSVKIRSVLTCKSQFGVCIKCYGADLANQAPVEVGEAVGIIAAQSIGEPGTQLTMRTFHTGGVAGDDITQGLPRVEELFEARKPKHNAIISEVEGEVRFGKNEKNDLPLITVIPSIGTPREYTIPLNGAERVIVSQLVRSPGVYYDSTFDQTGKKIFTATLIPNRGAWIELETEPGDKIRVRIDRTRKMPVTYLLRALGFETDEEILALFDYNHFIKDELDREEAEFKTTARAIEEVYKHIRPNEPITSTENAQQLLNSLFFDSKRYDLAAVGRYKLAKKLGLKRRVLGKTLAEDIVDNSTGEILIPAETAITEDVLNQFFGAKRLIIDKTLAVDFYENEKVVFPAGTVLTEETLPSIFKVERWQVVLVEDVKNEFGEIIIPANKVINEKTVETIDSARESEIFNLVQDELHGGFINPIPVRVKSENGNITMLCAPTQPIHDSRTLCIADIVASIGYLIDLMEGVGSTDDIDHLGNRRVRSVGELLQNQFRIGLSRMERVVRDRMTTQDSDIITPQILINIKPVIAAMKEFFGSSQLSQFMDQHNPLSELTHKRRLSALGPGGLSRERAGFEVRDVHNSHYGRMCPIETPEGPNIGLIGSLSNYGRIDQYGFVETPYRRVDKKTHTVTNDVVYMTADEEEPLVIAQANEPLDENDKFINERVTARHNQETSLVNRDRVDFMDVSPKQVVSIATALIPFLENDDANRALMGANMQRQAVPLLKTQAPLVGTGMEYKAACDSGVMVLAKKAGVVSYVDSSNIHIDNDDGSSSHFKLQKFVRSNQGTCINQIPIVRAGERVFPSQPLADGPSTDHGELALGYNIVVAYMPWEGYNYEDAILLSENLIKQDIYTSIHIEEHQCDARDTKLGPEEVTRDIPNVSDDSLINLDSDGIVAIGADVRPGDILVGKVTPKGETELTAEERLLRAIFGEKAREVRDTSLRVPHGESGKIVDVKIFTRDNNDEMAPGVNKQVRVYIAQKRKISVGDKMSGRHGNKGVVSQIMRQEDMPFLPDGTPVDIVLNPLGVPSRMNIGQILESHLGFAVRILGASSLSFEASALSSAGLHVATPVFDGAREQDVLDTISLAGLDSDGKSLLFDGRTGEPFENRVTVGCVYMLKLHHLVDDKIHARSTGPYSLVTQQPLGGKAQFGGRVFGVMTRFLLDFCGAVCYNFSIKGGVLK